MHVSECGIVKAPGDCDRDMKSIFAIASGTQRDLGDGTMGIVVGVHNPGHLSVEFFETADFPATREY